MFRQYNDSKKLYLLVILFSKRRFCVLDSQAGTVWQGQRSKIDLKPGEPHGGFLRGFVRVSFLKWEPEALRRKVCPERFILGGKKLKVGVKVLAVCIYSLFKMQTSLVNA